VRTAPQHLRVDANVRVRNQYDGQTQDPASSRVRFRRAARRRSPPQLSAA
jgi:hypothetical protein